MIDIHCHLLPGIDDGPPDDAAALALARALVDDGVTQVVCTPHVFPGRYENRRSSIADEFDRFAALLEASGILLPLRYAGEVRLTPEVLDLLPRHELPWLGRENGRYTMLLEMPDGQIPLGADRFVRLLLDRGVRPVIVHPERNRAVMDDPARIEPLVRMGCALQLTAGSLLGDFGPRAQATAVHLLDQGQVQAVASDAHNLTGRRPRMRAANEWLTRHYGADAARHLTREGPAQLSQGNVEVRTAQQQAANAGPNSGLGGLPVSARLVTAPGKLDPLGPSVAGFGTISTRPGRLID